MVATPGPATTAVAAIWCIASVGFGTWHLKAPVVQTDLEESARLESAPTFQETVAALDGSAEAEQDHRTVVASVDVVEAEQDHRTVVASVDVVEAEQDHRTVVASVDVVEDTSRPATKELPHAEKGTPPADLDALAAADTAIELPQEISVPHCVDEILAEDNVLTSGVSDDLARNILAMLDAGPSARAANMLICLASCEFIFILLCCKYCSSARLPSPRDRTSGLIRNRSTDAPIRLGRAPKPEVQKQKHTYQKVPDAVGTYTNWINEVFQGELRPDPRTSMNCAEEALQYTIREKDARKLSKAILVAERVLQTHDEEDILPAKEAFANMLLNDPVALASLGGA